MMEFLYILGVCSIIVGTFFGIWKMTSCAITITLCIAALQLVVMVLRRRKK